MAMRDRAEERLLEEAGLQRDGDRGQPREVGGDDVRVAQRRRGHPPAEVAPGHGVEHDDVREEQAQRQIGRHRLAQHAAAAGHLRRPDPPELELVGEGPARQALAGREGERRQAADEQRAGQGDRNLLRREASGRHGGVVAHPQQRPARELHGEEEPGDEAGPLERRLPDDRAAAQQHEEADDDPVP